MSQATRSATQLAVEFLEALHQDVEPQDHLAGIRDRYTTLIENSRDAPDDVLGANRV